MVFWNILDPIVEFHITLLLLVNRHVVLLLKCLCAEKQKWLPNRPFISVHDIALKWACYFIGNKGNHKCDSFTHFTAITCSKVPQIILRGRKNLTNGCHCFEAKQ